MRDGHMHQTTVRFGPDLWEALEAECGRLGMSAAQYVREAALARLHYTAGREGDDDYADALSRVSAQPGPRGVGQLESARKALDVAVEGTFEARAVTAQSELTLSRARVLRDQSAALRRVSRSLDRRVAS
jgi:hypothetical protein